MSKTIFVFRYDGIIFMYFPESMIILLNASGEIENMEGKLSPYHKAQQQ